MDWKELIGKKVFFKLKEGDVYTGEVLEVDDDSPPLIWITISDKFNNRVTFVHSEIIKIEELEE